MFMKLLKISTFHFDFTKESESVLTLLQNLKQSYLFFSQSNIKSVLFSEFYVFKGSGTWSVMMF
jgi:hypothetical protein